MLAVRSPAPPEVRREPFWIFEYPKLIIYRLEPRKSSQRLRISGSEEMVWVDAFPDPWDRLHRFIRAHAPLHDVDGKPVEIERFALIQRGLY